MSPLEFLMVWIDLNLIRFRMRSRLAVLFLICMVVMMVDIMRSWIVCFFFSCRRRHTIFDCDWSSDVCSSDLAAWPLHVGSQAPCCTAGGCVGGRNYRAHRSAPISTHLRNGDAAGRRQFCGCYKTPRPQESEIGRASGRGRELISVGGGLIKKK